MECIEQTLHSINRKGSRMPPENEKDAIAEDAGTQEAAEEAIGPSGQIKVKFEIYGEEMIEKKVKSSGNSGRVYLPPNWVGHQVKIIRID